MLRLEFETANAAFHDAGDGGRMEAARILRQIADAIDGGADGGPVRDGNGNKVGRFTFAPDQEG